MILRASLERRTGKNSNATKSCQWLAHSSRSFASLHSMSWKQRSHHIEHVEFPFSYRRRCSREAGCAIGPPFPRNEWHACTFFMRNVSSSFDTMLMPEF